MKKTYNIVVSSLKLYIIHFLFPFRNIISLILLIICTLIAEINGQINVNVFLRDSNTPIELIDSTTPYHIYEDIMAGTRLKIIISSNSNASWGGDLAFYEEYWPTSFMALRPPLPAAGLNADAYETEEPGKRWYSMYTGNSNRAAGDWFIVDYNAIDIGECNIGYYDHDISWDEPVYYLCLSHAPSRDFNSDNIVNFSDYQIFTSHWQDAVCQSSSWCQSTDLDSDGDVDIYDLMLFCEFWLEKTR